MQLQAQATDAERSPAHGRKRRQDNLFSYIPVGIAKSGASRKRGILQVCVAGPILISCPDEVISARRAERRWRPKTPPGRTEQRRSTHLANRRWRHTILAAE